MLGTELADGRHGARAALARVLDHPHRPAELTVHLHPDDLVHLAADTVPEGVCLVPDAALTPGDAVAHYADGVLDARLEQAFARAHAALHDQEPA